MTQKEIQTIPLCSHCIRHEILAWLGDKQDKIHRKLVPEVLSELRSIKIVPGKCIVCNHNQVSENSSKNILKILEHHKSPEEVTQEFKRFFCF